MRGFFIRFLQSTPSNLLSFSELPRARALQPGGPLAKRFLAPQNTVLTVGSTVFVHAGLLPRHVTSSTYASAINKATREWMLGRGPLPTAEVHSRTAVTWTRDYALQGREDCAALRLALAAAGMQRMVVGHTIQDEGIRSACAQRVYCIDVGLSRGCTDGSPEVLEIIDDKCVWGTRHKQSLLALHPSSQSWQCVRGPSVALTQICFNLHSRIVNVLSASGTRSADEPSTPKIATVAASSRR